MNVALLCIVVQSKPYLWDQKMYFTLIVCCSYIRYLYILNQSTNYYTFIVWNHKTKISIKLLLDVKLLVTIWMEPNIAIFTKVQSGFLTWGASPLLSLAYPDCVISNFITDFWQLSCRGEDIYCCWFSKTSIISINNTSPKSQ